MAMAPASIATRIAMAGGDGMISRAWSATSPTTITLLTVPKPGRCRSGIQASSTMPLTPMTTQPIGTSRCLAMP
jgi:surfactin synthase thioesterase subunit